VKIRDILAKDGLCISFEHFPPKTLEGEDALLDTVKQLRAFEPAYVSVTYGAGGSTREGTRRVVKRILDETGLTVMPHLTCVGSTRDQIRAILEDYRDIGVENILALRGDLPEGMTEIPPESGGFRYASELVAFTRAMDCFSIGVAVYPEGHLQAASLDEDIYYTKLKVDAGADFCITQMFFENHHLYGFMDRAARAGIDVPIICGMMPIAQFDRIKRFASLCGATIPARLEELMARTDGDHAEMMKIGMDWVTDQVADLMRNGFKLFHIYTLNRYDVAEILINNLGIRRDHLSSKAPRAI
jgi:methylenetetrahydrofolate reductase (NADPH)